MSHEHWNAVDTYFAETLIGEDAILKEAAAHAAREGLPEIQVAPNQGKLLMLLAQVQRAERILEVGTLGGYSTIWLARGLPEGGRLVTIELDPHHADIARANIDRAGLADTVEIRTGRAVDVLEKMATEETAPFDLVFLDADKASYPAYLNLSLRLSRPGTLIIADNVVRNGGVASATTGNADVDGVRSMLDQVAANPRLTATAIQSVGSKGWDGFALIRVKS